MTSGNFCEVADGGQSMPALPPRIGSLYGQACPAQSFRHLCCLGHELSGHPLRPGKFSTLPAWSYALPHCLSLLLGYSAYIYLISSVSPALATSYVFVNPIVATMLGIALGGVHITGWSLLGLGLILVALKLVTKRDTH
jgi:drug/metabolite transporter (DMT)-like permease